MLLFIRFLAFVLPVLSTTGTRLVREDTGEIIYRPGRTVLFTIRCLRELIADRIKYGDQYAYLGDAACSHGYDPQSCQDCVDEYLDLMEERYEQELLSVAGFDGELTQDELDNIAEVGAHVAPPGLSA